MVDGSSTKLAKEFLGSEVPQVSDEVGPEVKDIVTTKSVSFLNDHGLCPQQSTLNGSAETTRPSADDQNLQTNLDTFCQWQNISLFSLT